MFWRKSSPAANALQAKLPDAADVGHHSLWRRLLDFVFGYDFFISYSWSDGGAYASALTHQLRAQGFETFLDRDTYASGDDWKKVGAWKLRRTGQLVLIGSPAALVSAPVIREIEIFSNTGRRIVPIDFDGSLDWQSNDAPLARYLPPEILRIREPGIALTAGPSAQVVAILRQTFNLVRQDQKRVRVFGIIAFVLGILAVAATGAAVVAWQQRNEATRQALISAHEVYAADLELSEAYRRAGDPNRAVELLRKRMLPGKLPDPREFAWRYLWRLYDSHRFAVTVAGTTSGIDISPDGKTLAIANGSSLVTLWDIGTGQQVGKIVDQGASIESAIFVAGGARVATKTIQGVRLWDRQRLDEPAPTIEQAFEGALASARDKLIMQAGSDQLQLVDARTGSATPVPWRKEFSYVTGYSMSPDGKTTALATTGKQVVVLDAETGQIASVTDFPPGLNFAGIQLAPNGTLLIAGASQDKFHEIVVQDLANGNERLRLHGPGLDVGNFVATAVSHDGGKIALLIGDPAVFSPDQHSKLVVFDARTGQQLYALDTDKTGFVTAMAFSPTTDTLAIGNRNHELTLWDAQTGRSKAVLGIHHGGATRDADSANDHREENTLFSKSSRTGAGISTILFSPDGASIVTANAELGMVRVWNADVESSVYTLPFRADHHTAIAFSPDGNTVVTGDGSGAVVTWLAKDGSAQLQAAGPAAPVSRLVFSAKGDAFASASEDGAVKLWRAKDLAELGSFKGTAGAASALLLGEGRLVHLSRRITNSGAPPTLTSWPLGGDAKPVVINALSSLAALSPNGERLALLEDGENKHACQWRIWDVTAGVSRTLPIDETESCWSLEIQRAAWSPDGKLLAFGGPGVKHFADDTAITRGAVRILDVDATTERPPLRLYFNGQPSGLLAGLEFTPDGRSLAVLSAVWVRALDYQPVVTLWDVASLQKKATFPVPGDICGDGLGVTCVQLGGFAPDGKALALFISGRPGGRPVQSEVLVWNLDNRPIARFAPARSIGAMALSPAGDRIATVTRDRDNGEPSILWDLDSGRAVATLGSYERTIDAAARSPDGRIVVQTLEHPAPKGTVAKVWDLMSGQLLTSGADLRDGGDRVTDVSSNGELMAELEETGSVTIRDSRTRRVVSSFDSKMELKDRPDPSAWPRPLLIFGPQGRTLAIVGAKQTTLWDVKSGSLLHKLADTPPVSLASGDGAYAAMVDCKTINVYDTGSGRQVSTVSNASDCVNAAVVSTDGAMLLSLMSAGFLGRPAEARLSTLAGPSSSMVLTGYDDGGAIGTFSLDGKTIATAGPKGAVNFWDPLTGRRLLTLPGFDEKVSSLRFSNDGRVLTVGYAKEVRLWYATEPR